MPGIRRNCCGAHFYEARVGLVDTIFYVLRKRKLSGAVTPQRVATPPAHERVYVG